MTDDLVIYLFFVLKRFFAKALTLKGTLLTPRRGFSLKSNAQSFSENA